MIVDPEILQVAKEIAKKTGISSVVVVDVMVSPILLAMVVFDLSSESDLGRAIGENIYGRTEYFHN